MKPASRSESAATMPRAKARMRTDVALFFILLSAVALGNGLSDSIFANYFKEVYGITAFQRGLIEGPRELPGLLCALVIGMLGFLGDLRVAFIAQLLSIAGITALGLFTPSFGLMLFFLFINSLGLHVFMPLQDAIGMDLAEPDQVGRRLGQFFSVRALFSLLGGFMVFFGFRSGLFSFGQPVKVVFLISAGFFACAALLNAIMIRHLRPAMKAPVHTKMLFRREYRFFYLLTVLRGVQKQIANVYGTWVIVDLLMKKADTLALLTIAIGFLSIFFTRRVGRWSDRYGIKRMMYLDALSFIGIYVIYGFTVWGFGNGTLPYSVLTVGFVYFLFVLDRLSMQIGMVNSIYLRTIAWNPEEITATLSMGVSLDHVVSILAALAGGFIWSRWGSQWVFFLAAAFSLGNLYVAWRVEPEREREDAERRRSGLQGSAA